MNAAPKHIEVYCIDGIRKGRVYSWPAGTQHFQINTLMPGSDTAAYYGAPLSGYAGFIYKVFAFWGSGRYGARFDRLAYR